MAVVPFDVKAGVGQLKLTGKETIQFD